MTDVGAPRELARYESADGQQVVLTDVDIAKVICDNPQVTRKEMKLFVELCKAQRLNPFVREAYLVKYGDRPATIVTGKDVFLKRAQRNPRFRGYDAGVTVVTADGSKMVRRDGSMALPGERLVGGWCRVHVEGYESDMFDEVAFEEYAGRKKDGSLSGQWAKMPGTMIRKVAIVHALREAFPDDLSGLYDAAEMQVDEAPRGPEEATAPHGRVRQTGEGVCIDEAGLAEESGAPSRPLEPDEIEF